MFCFVFVDQGLPDPVSNISSNVTCNSTCIFWLEPSQLPVNGYIVTVKAVPEVESFITEEYICYLQDIIEPNTNTSLSIAAINEVGKGDAVEAYVLSSMGKHTN